MSNDKELILDIDALLDGTIDDLSDVPVFAPFPIGTHRCNLSLKQEKIGKFHAVKAKFVAIETMELANANDTALAPGDNTTILFFLTHENPEVAKLGQGQFKELAAKLNERFGDRSNRTVIEDTQDVEVLVATGLRENKKNVGTFFTDIKELHLV